jgi:hypothetical protein
MEETEARDALAMGAEEALGDSILSEAQKEREQAADQLFLDIPSWDGALVGCYRDVGRKSLQKLARKAISASRKGDDNSVLQTDIDLIWQANVGVYVHKADLDESTPGAVRDRHNDRWLVPLTNDFGTVTFKMIGDKLGRDFKGSTDTILYLFAKDGGDAGIPIGAHSTTIARWLKDPSKGASEPGEV